MYCVATAEAVTASRDVIYRLKEKFLHDGEDMYGIVKKRLSSHDHDHICIFFVSCLNSLTIHAELV